MRIAVIADVHSNLPALVAVIAHAGEIDLWLCAGDTVGYGAFPNECVRSLRELGAVSVAGNHDLGAVGSIGLEPFNRDARLAAEWTREVLGVPEATSIRGLPETVVEECGDYLLVHGSPRDPLWEYVLSPEQALGSFESFESRICFHGHSHIPYVYRLKDGEVIDSGTPADGDVVEVGAGSRLMINVGSVGQPRDGDPRACYAVYEPDRMLTTFCRVGYDVGLMQARMEEAGLPASLGKRLATGR